MKTLKPKYQSIITIWHFTLDPLLVMLCLGAFGHMKHISFLYELSYLQVFLANAALQFIWPMTSIDTTFNIEKPKESQ